MSTTTPFHCASAWLSLGVPAFLGGEAHTRVASRCLPGVSGEKTVDLIRNLRYFRIFIALWNIVIMFLMIM